ncbi:ABC transporter ATP-binding protein [Tomitella gaofuii]|uniref:ABC transporter ATP-binding protein n=1 Tax=Tomitella gaofuii TaxID=2760083 RepID=UPI0015F831BB|nr:ABC transporter ATP-binding protein [Tomitella gaofuii]
MESGFPPVEAVGLSKTFRGGSGDVVAVDDVSLTVDPGTIMIVTGPSGSGKSTLLQLLAGLDRPDRGHVRIDGVDLSGLRDRAATRLRRDRIGFVFQSFQLLPQLTAEQNIALPLRFARRSIDRQELLHLADLLGIADRLDHLPAELSGGQQQRVAVARALITGPDVVFADEPTGALDAGSAGALMDVFDTACRELGQTFVIVTHDARVAARAEVVFEMAAGRLTRAGAAPVAP